MKAKLLAAVCAIVAASQAPHALAGTGTVTYFGVVDNTQTLNGHVEPAPDYDVAHLFGRGNLEGDFLTATFVYDTSRGFETTDGATYDELDGGSSFFTSSPLLSATLTVQNARTGKDYLYSFTPDYYADVYTSAGYLDEIGYSTAGDQTYTYIEPDDAGPTSLSQSFSGTGYGSGSYFDPGLTNTKTLDSIVFDTLSVNVTAVPEPSTWALMIAGVGLVGFALRRRPRPAMAGVA